jgi:hypothetical protein
LMLYRSTSLHSFPRFLTTQHSPQNVLWRQSIEVRCTQKEMC